MTVARAPATRLGHTAGPMAPQRAGHFALLIVTVALAAAGCGKSKDSKPAGSGSAAATATDPAPAKGDELSAEVLAGVQKYRDLGCACPDVECANRVMKDMGQWMLANASRFKDVKGSPEEQAAAKQAEADRMACMRKLQEAAPAPAPSP